MPRPRPFPRSTSSRTPLIRCNLGAVVLDGSDQDMQRLAQWTNLSETGPVQIQDQE
jgi:hypothetical protein